MIRLTERKLFQVVLLILIMMNFIQVSRNFSMMFLIGACPKGNMAQSTRKSLTPQDEAMKALRSFEEALKILESACCLYTEFKDFGEFSNYWRWMVGMSVYLKGFVIRFSVWFVVPIDKLKVVSRKMVLSWLA